MKNMLFVVLMFFGIIILILFLSMVIAFFSKNKNKVCVNNNCFEVEVALTLREKSRGLMFKQELAENAGMFFIYDKEDIYSFWMKNMNFPLDIIWINRDKKIVHIEKNLQPCQDDNCQGVKSKEKAMYILEINSGLTEKLKIKEGDSIVIQK